MRPSLALAAALFATPLAAPIAAMDAPYEHERRNTDFEPAFAEQFRAPLVTSHIELTQTIIAQGLEHPWGIAVLPDGAGLLVTERAGNLRFVSPDGTLSEPVTGLPEVLVDQQGGLLDVSISPEFAQDRRIFWTYAKPLDGGLTATAAAFGTLSQDHTSVSGVTEFFVQSPGVPEPMHFGSRVLFDNAGHVFVTTGEHFTEQNRKKAQDTGTTFGKTVRYTLDGGIPQDNPMVSDTDALPEIWSMGHRNIQGAFFDDGALWVIEHGPKGGDELNKVTPGGNFGWPVVSYGEQYSGQPIGSGKSRQDGMEEPVYFWDPVIAPAGMVKYDGDMFSDWSGDVLISSLHPGGVVRLEMVDGKVVAEERLLRDIGRVRDIAVDADGSLLIVTDFEDGALIRLTVE